MRLSSATICLNEDEMIGQMIDYLQDIVDEIIIVDGGSTDNTLDIILEKKKASKVPIHLFQRQMPESFADQRTFAMKQCRGQWILQIDCDEMYTPSLARKLPEMLQMDCFGFSFPTLHLIKDKNHYSNITGADPHVRLFKRDPRIVYQKKIHEVLAMNDRVLSPHKGQCQLQGIRYCDDIALLHYGPLKSMPSLEKKQRMWNERNYIKGSVEGGDACSDHYFTDMHNWEGKEMAEINWSQYV